MHHKDDFGGIDVILIGDLRQLSAVKATDIYKTVKTRMVGPHLWRTLKFYELTTVMRQANVLFSNILTKIGNGEQLSHEESLLIESRFLKKIDIDRLSPDGVHLFFQNTDVDKYNNFVLQRCEDKVVSTAIDVIIGAKNHEQEANFRVKLHKKSVIDTGGLPYEITFVIGKYYLLTANIDVSDGLSNGSAGQLVHLDFNDEDNTVKRVWLEFCGSKKIGKKKKN